MLVEKAKKINRFEIFYGQAQKELQKGLVVKYLT